MRVAALYDIHGNLPALEAVLREVRRAGVHHVVVGGDVLPGPMPRESLAALAALQEQGVRVHYIGGNGEREVIAARRGAVTNTLPQRVKEMLRWTAAQLTEEDLRRLEAWPPTLRLSIDHLGTVLFCHATPFDDTTIFTRSTPDARLLAIIGAAAANVVVCGHTHMAFDRSVNGVRVVNAGSVGMPFGAPGAHWLLLGPGVELRHTPYDLAAAAARIRGSGYPDSDDFAANNVLQPPSEERMLAAFAPMDHIPLAIPPA